MCVPIQIDINRKTKFRLYVIKRSKTLGIAKAYRFGQVCFALKNSNLESELLSILVLSFSVFVEDKKLTLMWKRIKIQEFSPKHS